MRRCARVCDVGSLKSQKTNQNRSQNAPQSFRNRTKLVPEGPETVQIASPRPLQLVFSAQVPPKCVPDDFWVVCGRFLGGSWAPTSSRNRQKWHPKRVPFSIRFRTSVLIGFRCVLVPKMVSEIDVFGVRNRSRRIWAKTSKLGEGTTLPDAFSRSGTSKSKNRSAMDRNEAGFETRFGPRFGTIFGRFWGPGREEKRSGIRVLGTSNK